MKMKMKTKATPSVLDKIIPRQKPPRESLYRRQGVIRSVEDIIADPELSYDFINFFRSYDLRPGKILTDEADERHDEYLLALEELGLIRVDWQSLQVQQKPIGHRLIRFVYRSDQVEALWDRIEKAHQEESQQGAPSQIKEFVLNVTNNGQVWVKASGQRYLLASPNLNGPNDIFMGYAVSHEGQEVTRGKIEVEHGGDKILGRKNFHKIIHELGFSGAIKKAFFPKVSIGSFIFRSKVTAKELTSEGVNIQLLLKELELCSLRQAHTTG